MQHRPWSTVRVVDPFSDLYMREGIVTGASPSRINVTIGGAIHSFLPGCIIPLWPQDGESDT